MGKGKSGGPIPEDNEPDSPTPDFGDVTDVNDVADLANAADDSIDTSQSAADGDQAFIPLLVPVDNSIGGAPNPYSGQPVDPYTGQPPADPFASAANTAPGSTSPSQAGNGQPTSGSQIASGSAPANPFMPAGNVLTDNWQNLLAQLGPGNADPTAGGPTPVLPGINVGGGGPIFVPAPTPTTESGAQQGNPAQQAPITPPAPVTQPAPVTAPVGPDQAPPSPPTAWSPKGEDLWGGAAGGLAGSLPPVPLAGSSPLSTTGQFLAYTGQFLGQGSTLPSGALVSGGPPLPHTPPGALFYGGQAQWPSSPPPPAELTGLIGFTPPSTGLDLFPYRTTVTDTGSTAVNYLVGALSGWDNVARFVDSRVFQSLQGVLGLLADLNNWLDEQGMNPNALFGLGAAEMLVSESIQYSVGQADRALASSARYLPIPGISIGGVGAWAGGPATSTVRIYSADYAREGYAQQLFKSTNPALNTLRANLLTSEGKFYPSAKLSHDVLIARPELLEMMHVLSAKAGGTQAVIGSAWLNQYDRIFVEGPNYGAFVTNEVLDIHGLPIERFTAQLFEDLKWLAPGTVAAAPRIQFHF